MAAEHEFRASGPDAQHAPGVAAPAPDLAKQLTGNLPCVSCGYNLRGLSVKSVCPECGTAVRAAILAAVDPYAPILQPVRSPRVVAAGLLLWAGGALVAALLTWGLRAADLIATLTERPFPMRTLALVAFGSLVASAVGSVVLIRPHARIPLGGTLGAIAGVAAMLALLPLYWRLHLVFDPAHIRPYFQMAIAIPERSLLRLAEAGLLLVIVLGLRPNARLLAARSLLMRLGRVDRQTLFAMATAVCIGAAGDVMNIVASEAGDASIVVASVGLFLISIGAMFFTVGLFGVAADVRRIVAVLLNPPAAPSEIVGPEDAPLPPAGEGRKVGRVGGAGGPA